MSVSHSIWTQFKSNRRTGSRKENGEQIWKKENLPAAEDESRQVDMQNRSKQLAQKKLRASEMSCRRTLAPLEKRNGDIVGTMCGQQKCQHKWWDKKNKRTSHISCTGASEDALCTITHQSTGTIGGLTVCLTDTAHTDCANMLRCLPWAALILVYVYLCDIN